MTRTLLIAEAGVNHNGSMKHAKQLIDVAAAAGADLVKFQTFSADRLVTKYAAKAGYQMTDGIEESQYEMIHRLELDQSMHMEIIEHCERRGVGFFSTAFDIESLEMLLDLGVGRVKVPSGEVTNLPFLRRVGSTGLPVIMSTGMATIDEVGAALDILLESGTVREDVTILHCTTQYPAPFEHVNLRAMETIREKFGVAVGYSDHTLGIQVAIAAVALGASVIEKHFTLDRHMPGPDHAASLEPEELAEMVRSIRTIEVAMGDGVKRPTPGELENRQVARKSIVAARAIRKGEIIESDMLAVKRPGIGISPMEMASVIGTEAVRDFLSDELIEL